MSARRRPSTRPHLYGRSVRWFHDPGVPDAGRAGDVALARRARRVDGDARSGPVHLNLPFREPLSARPGPLPRADGRRRPRWQRPRATEARRRRRRGCSTRSARRDRRRRAQRRRPRRRRRARRGDAGGRCSPTRCRAAAASTGAVTAFDAVLRHAGFAADHAARRRRARRSAAGVEGARRSGSRRRGAASRAGRRARRDRPRPPRRRASLDPAALVGARRAGCAVRATRRGWPRVADGRPQRAEARDRRRASAPGTR